MSRISLSSKDDYVELGNVINIGGRPDSPRDMIPSIQDIKNQAKSGAFVLKAKMFSDLGDTKQLDEYNQILGDEVNYMIVDEKSDWDTEVTASGASKKVYKAFLKYYEFSRELYDKNLKDLLEYHELTEDDMEEIDMDIVLGNKTEQLQEAVTKSKKPVISRKLKIKSKDISV